MAGNYARLGVGVKDDASGPLDRIRDKFGKLQQQGAKGFAIGAGAAVTAKGISLVSNALSGMGDAIGTSITAASNLNEAMSKNDAVFDRNADRVEDWADTAASAFGQSKRSALEAAGTYGNLFQAFGLGEDAAAKMSMRLVELASDLASFNNTSVDDALLALRSGLSGETEPLKRFGVALNDARLKEEALRLGLIETTKGVLPQSIKTQAAYALILKDTAKAQGDFERTSDGMANQMKITAAQAENVAAKFGEVLLPTVVEFQSTVIKALDRTGIAYEDLERAAAKGSQAAQAHLNALASKTGMSTDRVKDDLYETGDAATDMADDFDDAADDAAKAFEEMAGRMADAAQEIIDDFFDPIQLRAKAWQASQETAAAIEARRDAKTADDKRETADDIIDALDDQASALARLGKQGALTQDDIDQFEKDATAAYKALGKRVPVEIQKILKSLRDLAAFESNGVEVDIKVKGGGGAKKKRASGGPADGRTLVGEQGPEVVDLPPGSFVHNAQSAVTKGAMGGGAVYNFNLTVQGDLKARDGAEVLQTMRRLEAVARPVVMSNG